MMSDNDRDDLLAVFHLLRRSLYDDWPKRFTLSTIVQRSGFSEVTPFDLDIVDRVVAKYVPVSERGVE